MNSTKANQVILLFIVLIISFIFIAMIRYFLMAVFLAALFSALAMPVFNRFEGWFKGRKSLSAAMTLSTLLLIVFLPLAGLLGIVTEQAVRISRIAVPWVQQQILEPAAFDQQLRSLPFYAELELYREEILLKAGELASKTSSMLFTTLSSFTYSIVNDLLLLFIFLYTMFFFLRDGKHLLKKALSYLPLKEADQSRLLDKFLSVTRATIKGSLVVGIVQGSLAGLALHFAGIDSAIFWGTIMSIISILPILGPPLIWFPAVVYLAATGQYPQAIGVFLFCSIVVGQIDNILRPILIGRDTQMHELLIFFGTLGGIGLFGVFGFIIGPIIAALFTTVWEIYGETFSEYLTAIKGGKSIEPRQ
ncbi:MAG: AI-2E family transporter [Chlorobiales bacterium]|nr:AI-2E family transporter [Chlorobiales bacterium]